MSEMQVPSSTPLLPSNPRSRVPALRTLDIMQRRIGRLRGQNGIVLREQPDGGLSIGLDGPFSGTAWVGGVKTTGLNSDATKPYVVCDRFNKTAVESAGPIPDPFPADAEWYPKETTYGDIHVW